MTKKVFFIPFAILSALSCFSCSSGNVNLSTRLDRSGDLLVSTASTYATIGNQRDYKQMLKAMDNGENVVFAFGSYECTICQEFEPEFIKFMRSTCLNVYIFYQDDNDSSKAAYSETVNAIYDYYGVERYSDLIGRTPTIYIGNKDSYYLVSKSNQTQSYVENAIKTYADFSNLYYFSSFSNFSQVNSDDILTVLYSQSDEGSLSSFYGDLYEKANSSSKSTYVIDYDVLSEEDKASALSYFGLDEYSYTYAINKEKTDVAGLSSYYGS